MIEGMILKLLEYSPLVAVQFYMIWRFNAMLDLIVSAYIQQNADRDEQTQ